MIGLGKEIRSLLHLGWPIIGAQILVLSMSVVDTIVVGQLGAEPLAGLALGTTFYQFPFIGCLGLLSVVGALMARAHGLKDRSRLREIYHSAAFLVGGLSCVTLLFLLLAEPILIGLGQEVSVVSVANTYLWAFAWGIPAQIGFVCLRQCTEGLGDTRPSIVVVGAATILNALLDYALVLGKWGFPALGVQGAGWATAGVSWSMCLGLWLYIRSRSLYRSSGIGVLPRLPSRDVFFEVLRIGFPACGALLCEMAFFNTTTLLMGWLGTKALAIHQIALNSAAFMFMIPLGTSMALAVRVGHYGGRNDVCGVRRAGMAGFCVSVGASCFTAACFFLFPETILSVYSADPSLIEDGVRLLRIAAFFQIFDGLQSVGLGALRGLKDTRVPFWNTLIAFWGIGLPFGYWWTFHQLKGGEGLWFGMLLGLGAATLFHWWRFVILMKRAVPPQGEAAIWGRRKTA